MSFPRKGAEGHNFSGGDDNSTVLDFAVAAASQVVMPPTAVHAGVVPRASHASTDKAHIALSGGTVDRGEPARDAQPPAGSVKPVDNPRLRINVAGREVSRKTTNKPIFVKKLFERAFRHLDPKVKLGKRVESILGMTTFTFLRNLVDSLPLYAGDLHLLNGMMFSYFNLNEHYAHAWSRDEDKLLDAITENGRKIMVHKIFLPAVLNGRKLGARLLSKQAVALPPALIKQFVPNMFNGSKRMTAEVFFKVAMIVFIVRFVQRIHAFLKLTGGHTISEALLTSLTLNGVFTNPVPDKAVQQKWLQDNPALVVALTGGRKPRTKKSGAPTVIVLPSRRAATKRRRSSTPPPTATRGRAQRKANTKAKSSGTTTQRARRRRVQ